mmetsp:Transcript_69996/g.221793  ORF Transcript_69996/g.221793 Transcript_69996/m.221793 type:complete len:252 (-) Transcript_69996:4640-5395(-)
MRMLRVLRVLLPSAICLPQLPPPALPLPLQRPRGLRAARPQGCAPPLPAARQCVPEGGLLPRGRGSSPHGRGLLAVAVVIKDLDNHLRGRGHGAWTGGVAAPLVGVEELPWREAAGRRHPCVARPPEEVGVRAIPRAVVGGGAAVGVVGAPLARMAPVRKLRVGFTARDADNPPPPQPASESAHGPSSRTGAHARAAPRGLAVDVIKHPRPARRGGVARRPRLDEAARAAGAIEDVAAGHPLRCCILRGSR